MLALRQGGAQASPGSTSPVAESGWQGYPWRALIQVHTTVVLNCPGKYRPRVRETTSSGAFLGNFSIAGFATGVPSLLTCVQRGWIGCTPALARFAVLGFELDQTSEQVIVKTHRHCRIGKANHGRYGG